MRTRRLRGAAALSTILLLALTGCIKMDMDITLQPDDTVDGSLVFAVSAELAELSGEDPEELAEQMQQDITDSSGSGTTRTEPYDDGEYIGSTTFFEGQSLDYFGEGSSDPDALQIVREGDEFVVSGVMDFSDTGTEDMGDLGGAMDIRIAITFPGAVSAHDGTLDGTTVVWEPVVGERTEINARGSAVAGGGGLGGLAILPVALGALLLLAVIGVVVLLVLRNRRTVAPGATAPLGYADPSAYYVPGPSVGSPAAPQPQQFAPQPPRAGPPAPPSGPPAPPQAGPPAPPAPPAEPWAPERAPEQ